MKPQVLVTRRICPGAIEYLKQHCELDDVGDDAGLTADQLKTRLIGKQGMVAQLTDRFSGEVIDSIDGLKISANVAVGLDNVDVPAATRKGILVTKQAKRSHRNNSRLCIRVAVGRSQARS